MGWWKLNTWKETAMRDKEVELTDVDLEHIAEMIKKGYTEGELNDEEEEVD